LARNEGHRPYRQAETNLVEWRSGLPELVGGRLTLRELRISDASTLYSELTAPAVKRFIWAPPPSVAAFGRFIEWSHEERATGKYICYCVVPHREEHACGVFELRQLQPGFLRGEFGFVITPKLWEERLFVEAARLLLDFAFGTVRVHRIEARAPVDNDKGNAALERLGAHREGTLKEAFWRDDHFVDQYLWAILESNWNVPIRGRDGQLSDR
jgi:[ribosomal protein S5]-alanine N-acetyltransferase